MARRYYEETRSLKKTAERFHLSLGSLKSWHSREKWGQSGEEGEEAGMQNPVGMQETGMQNPMGMQEEKLSPFFSLPNLSSQKVTPVLPAGMPDPPSMSTKTEHREYCISPKTVDCFLSCYQGRMAGQRVSLSNPPVFLHGLIADYDAPLDDDHRYKCLKKLRQKPSFLSVSYSGGTHAVWLFEKPLPLLDASSTHELLAIALRELRLGNAFGKLDETAFFTTSQYYHRGWHWQEAGGSPLPLERLMLWQAKSWKKAAWSGLGKEIPLERVASEVERRYPGRWKGAFTVGARGVRFWDSQADNPTAAVVTPTGMVTYTGGSSFLSWNDIFGASFCEDYENETEGAALADFYCVNNQFWHRQQEGHASGCRPSWVSHNRQNTESILASQYGLRSRRSQKEDDSQVRRVIGAIASMKTLDGVVPKLYSPADTIEINGHRYLNISTVEALPPDCSHGGEWGEGFPWTADFLTRFFGCEDLQLCYFLSWLARAYQGALKHKPTRGQAIYIAGGAGTGKSFLSARIIAPLFGGRAEATDYLTGVSRFNRDLFGCGIWYIDDATPLSDTRMHERYSAMIKKMVANDAFLFEAKYIEAVKLPWRGRLVITCNTDPESLKILPAVDINNQDKLMFFRCTDTPLDDPMAEEMVREELPAFAAFLAQYETPEECRGSTRFGVAGFLHPELLAAAASNGASGTFAEVFDSFLNGYFTDSREEELRGSASDIYSLMNLNEAIRPLLQGLVTSRSIGTRLGQLAAKEGYPLRHSSDGKSRFWTISRSDFNFYRQEGTFSHDDCPF